jgi:diaminohydroxyphosphoribosylaminopyrimidine deaminase/5-amino-6-(5-phosphoribosylamino)uracil reductase
MTLFDQTMLDRALRLAMSQRGRVEPNPMVGCVLTRNEIVIGEAAHARFGGPHAEPSALAACLAEGHTAVGATAYVTLEPCCHTGKKTPPCAPRLIEAGIARVVVGCLDPNPRVNGQGIGLLRDAGVVVDLAPEPLACRFRQLIAPFILRTRHRRPYLTLKWAQTADGFVAGLGGAPVQISNPRSSRAVHMLRTRCDAIAVGVNTIINDDPMLTVREVERLRMPHRYVLDTLGRTPLDARVLHDESAPTTLVVGDAERAESLRRLGVDVSLGARLDTRLDLAAWVASLDATHVLVEPGPTLALSMLSQNLCDRLWVIRSPISIGRGVRACGVPSGFLRVGATDLAGDTLEEHLNDQSPAYFARDTSADFEAVAAAR